MPLRKAVIGAGGGPLKPSVGLSGAVLLATKAPL